MRPFLLRIGLIFFGKNKKNREKASKKCNFLRKMHIKMQKKRKNNEKIQLNVEK